MPRPTNKIGRKSKPTATGFTNYLKRKKEMKSYRNALATLVLTFVFSTSALADDGIIWTGLTPPAPSAESVLQTDIDARASEEDTLTEITLSLLQTLIPLF